MGIVQGVQSGAVGGRGRLSETLTRNVCCFSSLLGTWKRPSIISISQSLGGKNEYQVSSA